MIPDIQHAIKNMIDNAPNYDDLDLTDDDLDILNTETNDDDS